MIMRFLRWLFTGEPMCDHGYDQTVWWQAVRVPGRTWLATVEVHERCSKCGHIRNRIL